MEDEAGHVDEPSGDLGAVLDFLNTLDERSYSRHGVRRVGGDALTTAAALSTWLAGHGLVTPGRRASRSDLACAHELRAALRVILRARFDGAADMQVLTSADATLAALPLQIRIAEDGAPRVVPAAEGVRAALVSLAVVVAQAEARGTWKRMKMCAAADCHWVFFDSSRNGGGRWCSMAVCGNRDKTNKYRQRRASSNQLA